MAGATIRLAFIDYGGGGMTKMSYISVVIAASNEGYGGNFLERMQRCVDSILIGDYLAGSNIELVIVDWGTPKIVSVWKLRLIMIRATRLYA